MARKREQCRDTDSRVNTYILCVASLRHNVQYMCNMLSITKATVYIASGQVLNIHNSWSSQGHKGRRHNNIMHACILLGFDAQVLTRIGYIP